MFEFNQKVLFLLLELERTVVQKQARDIKMTRALRSSVLSKWRAFVSEDDCCLISFRALCDVMDRED